MLENYPLFTYASAHRLLAKNKAPVIKVAEQSGYQSETAFAKVFKKHFGYGPGKVRKGDLAALI